MYGVCQSASQLANVNVVCARTCAGKFANRRIRVTGNDFPSSPVYYYPAAEPSVCRECRPGVRDATARALGGSTRPGRVRVRVMALLAQLLSSSSFVFAAAAVLHQLSTYPPWYCSGNDEIERLLK